MDYKLNRYLEKIEKCLKPLPVSERVDIVKEIKSEMLELQGDGSTAEEIIERLGDPKELAKAYLGDLITKDTSSGRNRIFAICAYYSLGSLSGLLVIPTLAICAPVFILCGFLTLLLGTVKLADALLRLHIPYVSLIGVAGISNPVLVFIACVITGAALYFAGCGCFKLLVLYIGAMSKAKNHFT